ncbi:hypothetical protein ACKKBF_B12155 [Auxenochlorella protothecoides x Auxenochlorella symbiontica]
MGAVALAILGCMMLQSALASLAPARSFEIRDDQFFKDGKTFQIISGSIHYFRCHPALWHDRLERVKALGLNAITVYVAWNVHETFPGQYDWEGGADLLRFLSLAHDRGLLVVLRPGPYICAEWDFGGLPWWLGSSKVPGGRRMKLRSSDPAYLAHVDRWWGVLFTMIKPLMYEAGGPIILTQIENEYGFCGSDKEYLRHLVGLARQHLGETAVLFTTDPPHVASDGTLPGSEIFTAVDFGPGWFNPEADFAVQKSLNAPGLSPPFNSEFYSGWLTHWGESMANTSSSVLAADTQVLLRWARNTTSLSFYMVHGGSNFGFNQGANVDGSNYQPHITSYDYDAPISEAGDYCQPGIGGECKYHAIREVIAQHTGITPPPIPPRPRIHAYGEVHLDRKAALFDVLPQLSEPVDTVRPDVMEEYAQRSGLILYRHIIPRKQLSKSSELDLGASPHDYATVYLDGQVSGRMHRGSPTTLQLGASRRGPYNDADTARLDILVEAMGRRNFGCEEGGWDLKGLQSSLVTLNGEPLLTWQVFPLELKDLSRLAFYPITSSLAVSRRLLESSKDLRSGNSSQGPMFYKGTLDAPGPAFNKQTGHMADTYLSVRGWSKGIAWINGFNLGWHWASQGPQVTLYVPGPLLHAGDNEIVLLELEDTAERDHAAVSFVDEPDFYGPASQGMAGAGVSIAGALGRRTAHGPV